MRLRFVAYLGLAALLACASCKRDKVLHVRTLVLPQDYVGPIELREDLSVPGEPPNSELKIDASGIAKVHGLEPYAVCQARYPSSPEGQTPKVGRFLLEEPTEEHSRIKRWFYGSNGEYAAWYQSNQLKPAFAASVALSPDGRQLIVGGTNAAYLFSYPDLRLLSSVRARFGHVSEATWLSKDHAIIGGLAGIRIWNPEAKSLATDPLLEALTAQPGNHQFSPQTDSFYWTGDGIKWITSFSKLRITHSQVISEGRVTGIAFSAARNELYFGQGFDISHYANNVNTARDGRLMCLNLTTGKVSVVGPDSEWTPKGLPPQPHGPESGEGPRSLAVPIAVSPDGLWILVYRQPDGFDLINLRTKATRRVADGLRCATFSPDSQTLALYGRKGVELYNLQGKMTAVLPGARENMEMNAMIFTPDGQRILGAGDGGLNIWNVKTKILERQLPIKAEPWTPLKFSDPPESK